jgi:hypothetical protein
VLEIFQEKSLTFDGQVGRIDQEFGSAKRNLLTLDGRWWVRSDWKHILVTKGNRRRSTVDGQVSQIGEVFSSPKEMADIQWSSRPKQRGVLGRTREMVNI